MAYTFKVMKGEKIIAEATTFAEAQSEAERTGAHVLIPVPKRNPTQVKNPDLEMKLHDAVQSHVDGRRSLAVGDTVNGCTVLHIDARSIKFRLKKGGTMQFFFSNYQRNPSKHSKRNPSVYQLQPESKQAICRKVASLQVGDFVTMLQKGAAYSPDKVRADYQVIMRHGEDGFSLEHPTKLDARRRPLTAFLHCIGGDPMVRFGNGAVAPLIGLDVMHLNPSAEELGKIAGKGAHAVGRGLLAGAKALGRFAKSAHAGYTAAKAERQKQVGLSSTAPQLVPSPDGDLVKVKQTQGVWLYYVDRQWIPIEYAGWAMQAGKLVQRKKGQEESKLGVSDDELQEFMRQKESEFKAKRAQRQALVNPAKPKTVKLIGK
jgi:hypothetical protein